MKDIVRLRIPTPFPVGPINAYLIKSDPLTLIDTGPNTESAKKALKEALSDEGVRINDIKRVLITHAHSDHSGLAGWLEMQGAQIYIHPDEGRKLTGLNYLHLREAFLRQMGTPPDKIKSFNSSAKKNINASLSAFTPLQEGNKISGRINEMKIHHEQRLEEMYTRLSGRKTAFSLATNLYRNLTGWDVLLAVAEVCAHLDLLTERGLVKEVLQGNISYFEQTK